MRSALPLRVTIAVLAAAALLGLLLYGRRPMRVVRVENASNTTITGVSVWTAMGRLDAASLGPREARIVMFRGYREGSYYVAWHAAEGDERQFSCGYYSATTVDSYIDIQIRSEETGRQRCLEGALRGR